MTLPLSYDRIAESIDEVNNVRVKENKETLKLKDVIFDYEKNEFIYDGLEPSRNTTKKEIIKNWIKKLFHTERDRWNCHIYDNVYPFGLDIHKHVGEQLYPNLDIIELLKDDIYNSLKNNNEIKEIHYLQLLQIDDKMFCGFIVELVNGEGIEIDEVIDWKN